MPKFLRKIANLAFVVAFLASLIPWSAFAATSALSTLRVSTTGSGAITLAPGEVKNITVTFQNTGTATWKNDGPGYISLYTYGPKYRTSSFDPGTWLSPAQVKRMQEASVAPGGVATLAFQMRAPQTEGVYKETFNLASEDKAWIPGGEFTLAMTVKKSTSSAPSSTTTTNNESAGGYAASLVLKSANAVKVKAEKSVVFSVVFKNAGTTTWKSYGLKAPDVSAASSSTVSFAHSSWSGSQLANRTGQSIGPGQNAAIDFVFTAPKTNGKHTAKFQLTANDIAVPDAFVEIPVEVTSGAPAALNSPVVEDTATYIEEPTMRVAVLIVDEETDNEVKITSYKSDFTLQNDSGATLGEYPEGSIVRAAYENGAYVYNDGSGNKTSGKPLRFVPKEANEVMTITNFDRRVTRGTSYANNTFRNVLEIRYNTYKNRTWVINELPMEYYLRGLAETSNVSHLEFQKALLTAARTYAFYHWERATKHKQEGYHVDAYQDQVYWGYGQEERTPRITQSVEETRGQIVTYGGKTAITAYYSRSNGRTRDWSDVWGGDVPWSKSVEVPCDIGKTEWGHGVGMAASGALCMANEGKKWDEILKYFYTGIDIGKKWR